MGESRQNALKLRPSVISAVSSVLVLAAPPAAGFASPSFFTTPRRLESVSFRRVSVSAWRV